MCSHFSSNNFISFKSFWFTIQTQLNLNKKRLLLCSLLRQYPAYMYLSAKNVLWLLFFLSIFDLFNLGIFSGTSFLDWTLSAEEYPEPEILNTGSSKDS